MDKSQIVSLHDSSTESPLEVAMIQPEVVGTDNIQQVNEGENLNKSAVVDLNSESMCSASSADSEGMESSDDNIMIFNTTTESEASTNVSDATELNTTVDELFQQQDKHKAKSTISE